MIKVLPCFLVGLLCIIMGAINMTGNLSTLHSYHYHRVTEKDRIPFGRTVGLGTVVCGISAIVFGVCVVIFEKTKSDLAIWIGTPLLIVGLLGGMGISFYAMIKYNKGIF